MKSKFLILTVLCISLTVNSFAQSETIRGFLVDLKIVDMLTQKGAVDIQIFAAYDSQYKPYYVMTGLDGNGKLLSGKVYRQNETGDCPPTCDFMPTNLTNGGSFIDKDEAVTLINNYLSYHSAAKNAVKICDHSLQKVKSKGYNFMRVTFERNVKVSGVKDDGKVKWFAPFTHLCNTHSRESLGEEG